MIVNEGGTRWKSLSVIVDGILSREESVCRWDEIVGKGRNNDVDGKILIFSFGTVNWSIEFVIADRDWNL